MNRSLRSLMAEVLLLSDADFMKLFNFMNTMDVVVPPTVRGKVISLSNHRKSPVPHVHGETMVHRFGKAYKRRATIVRPFGSSLRELLEVKGMNQQEFARKVGVSPTGGSVSRWINGVSRPSESTVERINKVLGTSFSAK